MPRVFSTATHYGSIYTDSRLVQLFTITKMIINKDNASLYHWCTIDSASLGNLFNRIRIIIGEFGCTQIPTSSSCSFERKKDLLNQSFWFGNFLPRSLINLLTKMAKKIFLTNFLTTQVTFLAEFWVSKLEPVDVFKMFPKHC